MTKQTPSTRKPTQATTTPEPPETVPTGQPLLDLTRLLLAIRRKRRLWLCMSVVGLVAGAALAILMPNPPTAMVRILVIHEDDQPSDSGNLIRTDVALMDTAKIAEAALKEVGSRQKPEDFLLDYDVLGVTNNVLEVTVRANTSADAVRRAQALADVFIADHVGRIKTASESEAQALIDQRDSIQAELKQVNGQISTAERSAREQAENQGLSADEAQAQPNAAGLDSLYARRAELTSRISDLSQQAEEAGIGAPRVSAGTQIVDQPRPLKTSPLTTLVTNSAIGLLLGLILGWTFAAITGVVKDKPVLRKDIAANLGASVIAQLTMPRRGLARLWRTKRTTRERKRVAGTVVRLVRAGAGSVSVLELGSRRLAAALAVDVATDLAVDRDVVIVEDPAGRVVADDLPGRDRHELAGRADRPIRIVGADVTGPAVPGETRIGVGSVTPGTAWTDLRHLGGEALLVVRTGFANTAWLHTVARQLADNQIPIIGIVVVDPDPRDKSDGTLWDSLHTALRGRGRPVPELEAAGEPESPQTSPQQAGTAADPVMRPKPYPARKPEWAPEPVTKATPPAPLETGPESDAVDVDMAADVDAPADGEQFTPEPEPRVAEPAEPEPALAKPASAHYPAPVPARGVRNDTDLPTRRFAPVQPHLMGGNGHGEHGGEQSVYDLPTKRFAPVRQDVEDLAHRRSKS